MRNSWLAVAVLVCSLFAGGTANAQAGNGALDLVARITPTAAKAEPVRQFTFYVLTKSYEDITKDVEAVDAPPARDKFIGDLKISDELKDWLRHHDEFDLTSPDLDKLLKADDILHVPEFLQAYQRANSGGVTNGLPKPKYTDAEKTEHPEKYQKLHDEYFVTLKKFIQAHPESMNGVELELAGVNPQSKWALLQAEWQKRVQRQAPALAQTKYLATQVDTDLDGHASANLPAGNYWVSTLNLDARAGDARLRWDVPVTIQNGRNTRVELTNLNAIDANGKPALTTATYGSSKN